MRLSLLLAAATAALSAGCTMRLDERATGAAIGTGVGAVAGGLIGGAAGAPWVGAGIGGAAGGTAGYYVGKHLRNDRLRDDRLAAHEGGGRPGPTVAAAEPPPVSPVPAPAPAPAPRVAAPALPADPKAAARDEYELGRRATSAGDALRHYEAASRLDPTRPEPHNARGMVLAWQGRNDEARQAYAAAVAADPGYAPALENLRKLPR